MYDLKIRHLASVFVDAESITANAENITGLLKVLDDKTFLPVSVQELSLAGPVQRIGFTTPDGDWQLVLLGKRFDVTHLPISQEESKLGDFSSFCQAAGAKLIKSLSFFKRKAHRLAALQEGFLPDMPKDVTDKIVNRLFKFPALYSQSIPFEWDWRVASIVERAFGGLKEPTNTITAIKRWSGNLAKRENQEIAYIPLDRIRVDLDINTSPTNVSARFEETHITGFFEEAGSWHENLSSEIFSFISGR